MPRPNNPDTVYLDSSALISSVTKGPDYEIVDRVLDDFKRGQITLLISPLILVEARGSGRRPRIKASTSEQEDTLLLLLDNPRIQIVEVTRRIGRKARGLAIQHGLQNYDAIHLASAIFAEADVLMACDNDFPHDQEIDGVWVSKPYVLGDPQLY